MLLLVVHSLFYRRRDWKKYPDIDGGVLGQNSALLFKIKNKSLHSNDNSKQRLV